MEEKNSKVQSITDYREKLKWLRNRRVITAAAVVVLILAAAFGIRGFIRYRTFSSYEVVASDLEKDTLSSGYVKLGKNILRYGSSGASLMDGEGSQIWDVAFVMENPAAEVSGEALTRLQAERASRAEEEERGRMARQAQEAAAAKEKTRSAETADRACDRRTVCAFAEF